MKVTKLDLLAILCLGLEAGVVWWYHGLVWEMLFVVVLLPLQTILMSIVSFVIALFMSLFTMTFKLTKILKPLWFLSYRLIKYLAQKTGVKKLEEKTEWFPKLLDHVNDKKEKGIKKVFSVWKSMSVIRRFLYTLSFLPVILIFLLLSLGSSKMMRSMVYKTYKTTLTDTLIKLGFKKRK